MANDTLNTNGNELQIITFSVHDEEFGLNILQVEEIIRLPHITKLYNKSKYFKGIIDIREEVIPILDLREKFGLKAREYSGTTRAVIVEVSEKKIGIVVDTVSQVIRISKDAISPAPKLGDGIDANYLDGVVRYDERLIIMLNIDKLLSNEEIVELEQTHLQEFKDSVEERK